VFVFLMALAVGDARAQQPQQQPLADRDIAELLQHLEDALGSGNPQAYVALLAPDADRASAENFATLQIRPGITRVVVRERDRLPISDLTEGTGYVLILEVFLQFGPKSSVATWRVDARRYEGEPGTPARWRIHGQDRLTVVEGLYKLALKTDRQFRIHNLKVSSEDLTITIPSGFAYAADSEQGPTAVVLVGDGEMTFSPKPVAERTQVKLFAGEETLRTRIDGAFIRLNPWDMSVHFSEGGLAEEPVNPRSLSRAQEVFEEQVGKSFGLDLSDLSRDTWSLVPPVGDFLGEFQTSRFGTLTYTQAANESEDISLFDRKKRRNISAYASERKLATRGRFYSEDEQIDYTIEHYDIQTNFSPDREWLEGRTVLRLRVRSYMLGTLTLRLADSLIVHSVTSPRFGRLLSLRVKGQNSVLVNLPAPLARDEELTMAVTYAGRLESAQPDREVIALGDRDDLGDVGDVGEQDQGPQPPGEHHEIIIQPERRMVYTNRSYWYPQSSVPAYATAQLRLTVPEGMSCVASGMPASGNPVRMQGHGEPRQLYVFAATQPARYFAVILSRLSAPVKDTVRLTPAASASAPVSAPTIASEPTPASTPAGAPASMMVTSNGASAGSAASDGDAQQQLQPQRRASSKPAPERPKVFYTEMELGVLANPRQTSRARNYLEQATAILSTYANILHDLPYPSFTLALVDDPLPGGHSPAYFAVLHQPLPMGNYSWRNDPVSFDRYPQFFIAHELAHQFWGDAVGGDNYHEQWISEGFAQYFALLYAERTRSKDAFEDILHQLRRTSISYDRYGPVWLGYRLGHLQGDSRIFRALVYNKGALVLHMLRRLVGEDAFFRGLRRFYQDSRFKKVGTDDVRKAFEAESGQPLERFFERWIMTAGVPQITVSYAIEDVDATRSAGPPLSSEEPSASSTARPHARPGAGGSGGPNAGVTTLISAATTSGHVATAAGQTPASPSSRPASPEATVSASLLRLHIEQKGDVYDFPITVRLRYASGEQVDVIVPVNDRTVERLLPLKGRLEEVVINPDDAALVEVQRK
jgi:hypothetical protein